MRSSSNAAAALILLAGCSGGANNSPQMPSAAPPFRSAPAVPLPPEAGDPQGPAATSGGDAARYDRVGYAGWSAENPVGAVQPDAITAAHRTLPPGTYAEVTALDSGRTILLLIRDGSAISQGREIDLSRGAAALLGLGDRPAAPVRVRGVVAAAADAAALAAGRPAARRLDAPPALLAALRGQLGPPSTPPEPPVAPRAKRASRAPASRAGHVVQVAAFSSESRARALAKTLGGYVEPIGSLYRVRLGPFPNAGAAQQARDGAVRRGYGDATIIVQP